MTARRLGDILVEAGACSRDQLLEALDNQILLGGRIGTNLLELGAVTEESLAAALSRLHGVPSMSGAIRPEPAALALLDAKRADRYEVVPLALKGRRLVVLLSDPADLGKLDEVAFATGKDLEPTVVPEAVLWALLGRGYGVIRPPRGLPRRPPPPREIAAGVASGGPDLMSEEEFAELYADRAIALVSPKLEAARLPLPDHGPPAGPGGEDLSPLGFEEAVRALAGVTGRGAIARIVLRHGRSRFKRVLFLTVYGDVAAGWEGLGPGLAPEAVARIRVPLLQPGIVQMVVSSKAHFLGPLARTEANVRLLRALAGGAPRNAFAMPVLARGRVVNVLYADGGRGGLVDPDGVGELLILASRIAQTYDALLAQGR